jgi:hypothetical protein
MEGLVAPCFSLEPIAERILSSRRITRADQLLLLTPHSLTVQEQALVNRVFDRLRSGLIRVVD